MKMSAAYGALSQLGKQAQNNFSGFESHSKSHFYHTHTMWQPWTSEARGEPEASYRFLLLLYLGLGLPPPAFWSSTPTPTPSFCS